jgi:hypothetical protein
LWKRFVDYVASLPCYFKVKRLQNERDAFRAEALALDAGNSQLAKDLEALRSKLEVLEDDRNFLVRQMKKGHSKPARSPRPEQDSGQPGSPQKQHRGTPELLKTLNTPVSQHLPPIGGAAGKTKAGVLASSEEQQGQDRALSKGLRRELQGLKAALGIERRQLETMSREVGLVQGRRESNWLEALLLDCVRVVGGEVAQRRAAAEAGQGHSRRTMGGGGGGGGCGEATGASLSSLMSDGNELAGGGGGGGGSVQQQPSLVSDPWGETPLKLELFTAADRCSVLQTLISDPRVQRGLAKRRQDMEQQAIEERHNQRSREGQHQQGQGRGEGQPQSINRPGGNRGGNGGYGWDKQGDTPTRVSWIRGGE